MRLVFDNVGMINKCDIHINGITLITGENDTGKSTVGKVLYNIASGINNIDILDYKDSTISFINNNKQINISSNQIHFDDNIGIKDIFLIDNTDSLSNNQHKLFDKLSDVAINQDNTILDVIENIIGGTFYYDTKFYYSKNGIDNVFDMSNTSNGIKLFGILQLLIQNRYLVANTILILDEPEVYLHPKWQIELVKVLVLLVKNNIKILMTTHSPYIVEAISVYSNNEQIKTNFYLAKKDIDNIHSNIIDVTNDLDPIFDTLAEPYHILENLELKKIL